MIQIDKLWQKPKNTNQAWVRIHADQLNKWLQCTPKPRDRKLKNYFVDMLRSTRAFEKRVQELAGYDEETEDILLDELGPIYSDLDEKIRNAPDEETRSEILNAIKAILEDQYTTQ